MFWSITMSIEKLRNWCANHSTDHPNKTLVLAYSHYAQCLPARCQGMSPEMDTQRKEKPRQTKRDLEEDCYKGPEDLGLETVPGIAVDRTRRRTLAVDLNKHQTARREDWVRSGCISTVYKVWPWCRISESKVLLTIIFYSDKYFLLEWVRKHYARTWNAVVYNSLMHVFLRMVNI